MQGNYNEVKSIWDYDTYLIDLDGTVYRGEELIPGADRFINELQRRDKGILFVTNNSTRTPESIAEGMKRMGLELTPEHLFTSAQATARVVREADPDARVLVVGEEGLRAAMVAEGLSLVSDKPTHVVVGLDRAFDYAKLAAAARGIREGAQFLATNTDPVLITERGLTPGSGSVVAAVATASGCQPRVIGKPEAAIVELALERLGAAREGAVMIGDNVATDIAAGVRAGIDTLLVTCGVTSSEEAEAAAEAGMRPTRVWVSLADAFGAEG